MLNREQALEALRGNVQEAQFDMLRLSPYIPLGERSGLGLDVKDSFGQDAHIGSGEEREWSEQAFIRELRADAERLRRALRSGRIGPARLVARSIPMWLWLLESPQLQGAMGQEGEALLAQADAALEGR